ncbi:7877_t:CDS:2 [Ambispora leptoticha]|uniref:7877_t:CDS:1 n=1 Tax=Ambispora leptoticha TaxID=144679 RepID=A0A9N9B9V2_9GLOM|nr:7877_t:CDS:2 [Ambispora leptoticha]
MDLIWDLIYNSDDDPNSNLLKLEFRKLCHKCLDKNGLRSK